MAWRKKNKKDVPVVRMTDEELESVVQSAAELAKTQLPLGRVKKLIRMNPDVEMCNAEALQMMTKAAVSWKLGFFWEFENISGIVRKRA